MAKPRILLLDEPSSGSAPAMINELFDVLQNYGMTASPFCWSIRWQRWRSPWLTGVMVWNPTHRAR